MAILFNSINYFLQQQHESFTDAVAPPHALGSFVPCGRCMAYAVQRIRQYLRVQRRERGHALFQPAAFGQALQTGLQGADLNAAATECVVPNGSAGGRH